MLQNLQEKKTIEHLHSQLVATGGLIKTLEQHHVQQSDKIEGNLQRALEVYEQARVMRQQQNQLVNLISTLRRDLSILRNFISNPQPPHCTPPPAARWRGSAAGSCSGR